MFWKRCAAKCEMLSGGLQGLFTDQYFYRIAQYWSVDSITGRRLLPERS